MTLRIAKIVALVAALVMGAALPALAQLDANLGALTETNARGYLGPLPNALSGVMSTTVFQTGHVGRSGFNLTVGIRLMGVKLNDEERTYTPTDPPGFQGNSQIQAPTVIGSSIAVQQQGQGGATLYHPGGFDFENFTFAVPQATFGDIFGTRATVRYAKVVLSDNDFGEIETFGIGAQHSISQYLPGLPVDLAAGYFYQTFSVRKKLVDTKASNFNVTASKKFGILEPYVGVGYDKLKMDVEYESDTNPGQKIQVDFDEVTSGHFTAGATLGLGILKLNGEFNKAAETGVAVGLSFGK